MTVAKKPSRHRAQKLLQRYGITEDEYNAMLLQQDGRCRICARYRKLMVDHSHVTGKVRGLLCSHCNAALGFLEENVDAFAQAIIYIQSHKDRRAPENDTG